jgi:hypothetical protein
MYSIEPSQDVTDTFGLVGGIVPFKTLAEFHFGVERAGGLKI